MSSSAQVSIVIPNLHSPLIGDVVAALRRQTLASAIREIIVVGMDRFNLVSPNVQFIATPQPVAPAIARNTGARAAQGQLLLFLDADCIAAPDLIEQLIARHAAGQPVIGGAMQIETDSYWVLCDNLLSFTDTLASASAGERAYLPSFCLAVERELFEQAGGFDERFAGAAGEDIDLSMRLRGLGYSLQFEPALRVAHRPQRASARAVWQHQRGYGQMYYWVACEYPELLSSPLARLPSWVGNLLLLGAPALALKDIGWLLLRYPAARARASTLPGLIWGRIGWYAGIRQSLRKPARLYQARPASGSHR